MIGAIAGDLIGSEYEFHNIANEDFGPLFSKKSVYTDDTVLTIATADVILNNGSYAVEFYKYARSHPNRGWGGGFDAMVKTGKLEPYNSYGNGAIMRVSPVGWMYPDIESTLAEAKKSAECTHNNREGIKGAQAIASAMYWGRCGSGRVDIMEQVAKLGYDLSRLPHDFRQGQFDVTCQGTIPRVMSVFAATNDFESGMRKMVAMGGDVDTNCCAYGAIAEAFYGLPDGIKEEVYIRLPRDMANIVTAFYKKYIDENFEEPNVKVGSMTATFEDQLSSLFSMGSGTI